MLCSVDFDDGDAADLHRLEDGKGREHARAADADEDLLDDRGFLLRGIFVGDGPARRLRREAQLVLQGDFVDLDDDAVDFVSQLFALRVPGFDVSFDFVERVAQLPVFAGLEVHRRKRFEGFGEALLRARGRPTSR